MIACIAIKSAKGVLIDDAGPPARMKKKRHGKKPADGARDRGDGVARVAVEETIERQLHGAKGEVRGLLLSSGRIVRFPPHAADGARTLLKAGAVLAVRGEARTVSDTEVIEARAWGKTRSRMKSLPPKPQP
jgi:hypothetical protein